MPSADQRVLPGFPGILRGFDDCEGKWRQVSAESYAAISRAMEITASDLAGCLEPIRVVEAGQVAPLARRAELILEDGTQMGVRNKMLPGLPPGYHTLHSLDGESATLLLVTPGKCFLPAKQKNWGWALQLYALRSRKSWGMGDLQDMASFARWSRRSLDAGFILVNPLNYANPGSPQEASPYYPSSRVFKNPLYLGIEPVARRLGAQHLPSQLARAGCALNHSRLINRGEIFHLKMAALEILWNHFPGDAGFDRYCRREGPLLQLFATFCVLFETYGGGWRGWPARLRAPDAPGIKPFQEQHRHRIAFHQWVQWLLEKQFAGAAAQLPMIQDLPVGVNPDGSDAWIWQDMIAKNVAIGAPPDAFNTLGQNWGLPPFIPHKLRAAHYGPFRQTISAALRHAGGLRIDHVMGLFRLFWIPANAPPGAGAYVRYPAEELLAILAIESHRAKGIIIGEDLGTVERGVRAKLHRHNILSYRVLWFENARRQKPSPLALSGVSTHDLPSVAGLWNGSDLAAQKKLGLRPNEAATAQLLRRLRRMLKLTPGAPLPEVVQRIYGHLSRSDARLLSLSLEDALAVEERPNMPGITDKWPNWSLALPQSLESIQKEPIIRTLARILHR